MKVKKPPDGLKAAGKKFWKKVLSEYVLEDEHDLRRLELAAGCLDDIAQAETVLENDGRFIFNRYGTRVEHPAGKSIRETRVLFLRAIRELGLDLEPGKFKPLAQY